MKKNLMLWIAGFLILAILEISLILLGNTRPLFYDLGEKLLYISYTIALFLCWGIAFGIIDHILGRFFNAIFLRKIGLSSFIYALAIQSTFYVYIFKAERFYYRLSHHMHYMPYFILCSIGAVLLLTIIFYRIQVKKFSPQESDNASRKRMVWNISLFILALSTYLINISLFVDEYFYIHLYLQSILLVSLLYLIQDIAAPLKKVENLKNLPFLIAILLLIAPSLFLLSKFDINQNVKAISCTKTNMGMTLISLSKRIFDMDKDGFSSVLGGGDIDDFDAGVNPNTAEIPNNGIDDNCVGGDYKDVVKQPPLELNSLILEGQDIPADMPNVIIITLGELRQDHVGSYGYTRTTTPHIDNMAEDSILFKDAYTLFPKTPYAVGSILTGLHPNKIQKDYYHDGDEAMKYITLPEILEYFGYTTYSIVPDEWHDETKYWAKGFEGFDNTSATLEEHNKREVVTSPEVTKRAIDYIKSNLDKRFFLYVMYFDPHEFYIFHEGFSRWGKRPIDLYDGEIAFNDNQIGRLLNFLKDEGLYKNTLIVFSADGGEEFGEHGGQSHSHKLYNELLRIPLIIKLPDNQKRVIDYTATTMDIVPTTLAALGIKHTDSFDGINLLDDNTGPRTLYATAALSRSITKQNWKLIYNIDYNTFELYNLEEDPGEKINLTEQRPDKFNELKANLFTLMDMDQ